MKNVVPLPDSFDPDKHDASHIHTFLVKQGIDVQSVSLVRPYKIDGDDTLFLEVEGSNDLVDALDSFVPEPSEEEIAEAELEDLDIYTADLAELRKAVGLLKQMMNKKERPRV